MHSMGSINIYTTSYTVVYPAIRCGTPAIELVHPEAEDIKYHGVTILSPTNHTFYWTLFYL